MASSAFKYEFEVAKKDLLVRPCPYCGCQKILVTNTHTACYEARCTACGASVDGASHEKPRWQNFRDKAAAHKKAIQSAKSKWNRRPCSCQSMMFEYARLEANVFWKDSDLETRVMGAEWEEA